VRRLASPAGLSAWTDPLARMAAARMEIEAKLGFMVTAFRAFLRNATLAGESVWRKALRHDCA
jgi:hypothetical protein